MDYANVISFGDQIKAYCRFYYLDYTFECAFCLSDDYVSNFDYTYDVSANSSDSENWENFGQADNCNARNCYDFNEANFSLIFFSCYLE